jgi:hypothetical protein
MLRRIGERFGIPNVQTFEHLPAEWSILYELSRLELPTVEQLIEQGRIHSAMTERDAKAFSQGSSGHTAPFATQRDSITFWQVIYGLQGFHRGDYLTPKN